MKLALFGATGGIGSLILDEALRRGHEVVAIARDPAKLAQKPGLTAVAGDITDPGSYASALDGADAAVVSVSPRGNTTGAQLNALAETLLAKLPASGVKRLFWVGGAGSLEVAPGVRLVDTPEFPAEYKAEALALGEVLDTLRASDGAVDWTFVSPPILIHPGERTGNYRLGGDQVLFDADGKSEISNEDYAVALLDRIESNDAPRKRVTVAY
jgi:putative NADH-flavin reductase